MKRSITLCAAIFIGLGNMAYAQWSATGDSNRGTHSYTSMGTLGYSVRTEAGGGWAWQFADGANNPYFHVSFPLSNVGVGTSTPRGKFDVDGPGDIFLADDVNAGTTQSIYLPGHIFMSPFGGGNVSYLQARRYNNSGTTALQIRTSNSGNVTEAMLIEGNGNIGIGTLTPQAKLHVRNGTIMTSDPQYNGINLRLDASNLPVVRFSRDVNGSLTLYHNAFIGQFYDDVLKTYSLGIGTGSSSNGNADANNIAIAIPLNGNVGIGTTTPDTKLTVKGIVHCEEVWIDQEGALVPDYVFEESYDLSPLAEVEAYIKANKHLPEVPSAKEMEANGINVKEMNLLLLKKVEELTLHLIEMKKENEEMKERVLKLESKKN